MKKIYLIIILSMIGLSIPLILLSSTFSIEVGSDVGIYGTSGNFNVTLGPNNPLLANKYVMIIGGRFVSYEGDVHGNITVMNKATGANQTQSFYFSADSPYVEVEFGACEFTLASGEYTIFFSSNLVNLPYHFFSKGWLCNPVNPIFPEDQPNPNDVQGIICLALGGGLAVCAIALILKIRENRK